MFEDSTPDLNLRSLLDDSQPFEITKAIEMTRSAGNTIADSLALGLGYAERLLKDVPAEQFARFARPGGETIVSNHPAFAYGHLSLYGPRILEQLGQNSPEIPAEFSNVFTKDATCIDDADGSVYPSMTAVTEFFFTGYQSALEALRNAGDEQLAAPNPMGGPMTERFPTVGSMHNFCVGGHLMLHLGQVSAWRRMIGLSSA